MPDRLTENVIATRELRLSEHGAAFIVIGAPFAADGSRTEFGCPYQVVGIGSEKIKKGIGVDPVQALCHALYGISNDLYFSDEYKAGRLSWEGGMTIADLGLPVSEGMLESVRSARSSVEASKRA